MRSEYQPPSRRTRMARPDSTLPSAPVRPVVNVPTVAAAAPQVGALISVSSNGGTVQVAPAMVPYVQALRDYSRRVNATFRIVSGYRSAADQAALRLRWEAGDPSVVYPPAQYSYHSLGLAVDVASDHLTALGAYAESIGMRWGGRFGDPVHFDLGRA